MAAAAVASAAAFSAPKAKNATAKSKHDANLSSEFQGGTTTKTTAASFGPTRTTPVQKGEFQVDLVIITFPDCLQPESTDAVREALTSLGNGSFTIADYYKDYSQGVTWPVLAAHPAIYTAPHPFGYYCRYDTFKNLIGYKGDGPERARKLREDALKHVQSYGKLSKKGAYTCYVYCTALDSDAELREKVLRPLYPPKPSPEQLERGAEDKLAMYAPKIHWADPLWPNSIPQVTYPANGRTLVHELGHDLGAPDYYHATEEHDGMEGAPCLPWDYGPTGLAYCRYIYHAFVPASAYPKVTKPGEYTLGPRSARYPMTGGENLAPLGMFVPSTHPNYLFYLEYCHDEKPPVGNPSAEGLLVHVINVTMTSPMLGPPDLCYTYRAGDPDHRGIGDGGAYLHDGDTFDETSDPAAILPNFLPAGIAIKDIKTDTTAGTCTFTLEFPETKFTKQDLDFSLLPQTEMVTIDGVMPTSFHAEMNVKYRGEPLLTEYGFCYGLKKDPTEKTGKLFPLYHRDRYDARIIDLKPGTMYYVRAYAKNAGGTRYSKNQKGVTLPKDAPGKDDPTLFSRSDKLLSNWYFQKWYFGYSNNIANSANPLFAFMSLANYYRALPGGAATAGKDNAGPFDITRVHSDPAESRPNFRMAEVNKLRTAVTSTLKAAGLSQADFIEDDEPDDNAKGKKKKKSAPKPPPRPARTTRGNSGPSYGNNAAWVAKCAAALKVKNPEKVFFSAKTEEELLSHKDKIKEWILLSQPVLLVRQNRPMSDDESQRWPLDIALIDGLGSSPETFHVVFPGGCDRGNKSRTNGYYGLGSLLDRTSDAMLMFYRPGSPAK